MNMKTHPKNQIIKSISGKIYLIIARSDAKFCNSSSKISNITDVYYVSDLTSNLLSICNVY